MTAQKLSIIDRAIAAHKSGRWNKNKYTPPKLPAETITRLVAWRDDLKSGRYKQVSHSLRDEVTPGKPKAKPVYGYCCLGVACLTARRLGVKGRWDGNEFRMKGYDEAAESTYGLLGEGVLPDALAKWFGLDHWAGTEDPMLVDPETGAYSNAVSWNDDGQKTFDEIADMITFTFGLPPYVEQKSWDDKEGEAA